MPAAEMEFFIDPSRCIGCQACVHACSECETHKGHSMIHLEFIDRSRSPQTTPVVCMHCESPTCAEVCPADAIKRSADGVHLRQYPGKLGIVSAFRTPGAEQSVTRTAHPLVIS